MYLFPISNEFHISLKQLRQLTSHIHTNILVDQFGRNLNNNNKKKTFGTWKKKAFFLHKRKNGPPLTNDEWRESPSRA